MSNSKGLQIGIVGCGAFTELFYVPVLLSLRDTGDIELVFLYDPQKERTHLLSENFRGVSCVTDFKDALNCDVDLVIVASPQRFHAAQTIELLNCGIPVLCEKPMAATVVEAEQMIASASASNTLLAIGLFRRFFPSSRMIYEIVKNDRLGKVKTFEISEGGPFNWPAQSASFFQKSESQGGVLADLGVHALDLVMWWFGMPTNVEYEDDAMGGLEANCLIKLEFENNISGTVRFSRDTQLPNRTIIECEQGWLRCGSASADRLEMGFAGTELSLDAQLMNLGKGGPKGYRSQAALSYAQSFSAQFQNVLASIREEEELLVDGRQGMLSMRLIEQCYGKRKLMNMPWMVGFEFTQSQEIAIGK